MNHVNLIGKLVKPLEPVPKEQRKKTGGCFILATRHTELSPEGKTIARTFNHRVVLKDPLYSKVINFLTLNCDLAIEGYLYKGKVIVNDLIIL
jgi:hypothetical protein